MTRLQDRLITDLKIAMREHDVPRREALRMLRAAILNEEIEKQRQLDEAEGLRVVERIIKRHQDSIDQFRKGGRDDLVEYEQRQLATIQSYLPARLPPEEIEQQVREAIAAVGAQGPADSGKVMQRLAAALRGQADLREVSRRVQELLRA
jgi:uncharacterized protein YqeY